MFIPRGLKVFFLFFFLNLQLFLSLILFHQTQESLNPNNLEYWMEDIYTPGYDSLLKRKETEFRRAKVCKIGALIVAATCTVILVIVVPICTMKTWVHQDGMTQLELFVFNAVFTSVGLSCQYKMTRTAVQYKRIQEVNNIFCVSIGCRVIVLL